MYNFYFKVFLQRGLRNFFKFFGYSYSKTQNKEFNVSLFSFKSEYSPFVSKVYINYKNQSEHFYFRESSLGDNGVINQIFIQEDYGISEFLQYKSLLEYYDFHSLNNRLLIIDAGANIGASAVYFLQKYIKSFVYSIEPNSDNWNLLEINTKKFQNKFNFLGGLSDSNEGIFLENPNQSDWGFRTRKNFLKNIEGDSHKVKSITVNSILSNPFLVDMIPFIFKIDIEGGESEVFNSDTTWLNSFPLIIIELHDWMLPYSGSSSNFIKAISNFDFDVTQKGENLFLFNRFLLNK